MSEWDKERGAKGTTAEGEGVAEAQPSQTPCSTSDSALSMRIWVDADACPVVIKEILFRAAVRTCTMTTLVANRLLRVPASPYLKAVQVDKGFDVADNQIVAWLAKGDLVITADIPLAALVIAKQAHALNPRGEFYSTANIAERLAMRNFMEELRSSGVETSGPSTLNQADRQLFAAQLDRFLARQPR